MLAAGASCLACSSCGRGPFLDFPVEAFDEDVIPRGCETIDYLFVIDNSASMGDNQSRLVASFETFISGVSRSTQTVGDVHIGVVTTDSYLHNVEGCDRLGGLVVRTGGAKSSERSCGPYAEGRNFMTEEDELDEAFTCAARVGTSGSTTERPLRAAVFALGEELAEPGACNEGFVRPNAKLVVVFVTDEDAAVDPGLAYESIVEAKGGRSQDIVPVGFINGPEQPCELGGHETPSKLLGTFIDQFEHGFIGSICSEDYETAFEAASGVVRAACSEEE